MQTKKSDAGWRNKQRWIVLDCTNLAHRAFHSTGGLSYGGDPTGVIYGVLRDIRNLQDRFAAHETTVLCWDHGKSLREIHHPSYKETRRKKVYPEEEREAREGLQRQIKLLKHDICPSLTTNNFFQEGYEGDDIVASVVNNVLEPVTIVSGDEDFYQLICARVSVFHPKSEKLVGLEQFRSEYGISPRHWNRVKAIAGCSTDDVHGVPRVGEKTACKFIQAVVQEKNDETEVVVTNTVKNIWEFINSEQYQINKKLVTLPYPGVKEFYPQPENFDLEGWREVCKKYDLKSLM